jgi:hypothetical protein
MPMSLPVCTVKVLSQKRDAAIGACCDLPKLFERQVGKWLAVKVLSFIEKNSVAVLRLIDCLSERFKINDLLNLRMPRHNPRDAGVDLLVGAFPELVRLEGDF